MDLNFEINQARQTLATVREMWDRDEDPYYMIGYLEGRVQQFVEEYDRSMSVNAV